MATLAEIRTKVDNRLAGLWVNQIVPKEELYFARREGPVVEGLGSSGKGRYAQVLTSPSIMPEDDGTGIFQKLPPSDEQFPADFEFTIDTPIPMQLAIYTFDRGNEHGFSAHVWVKVNGKIYHRSKNYQFGEADVAWHEVTPN